MKPALAALFAFALLSTAGAATAAASGLLVTSGWSRPAVAGTNGVGYFTILNRGAKPEALVGVETPVAQKVEMHAMSMTGGVMRMAQVSAAPVPAGGKTEFGPGGYHLMLIGLRKPLNLGDRVPLTLTFASGAHVSTTLSVGVMPPTM